MKSKTFFTDKGIGYVGSARLFRVALQELRAMDELSTRNGQPPITLTEILYIRWLSTQHPLVIYNLSTPHKSQFYLQIMRQSGIGVA